MGKSEFRGLKREMLFHIVFWCTNAGIAVVIAFVAQPDNQDDLDYVFGAISMIPFVFMVPTTIFLVNQYHNIYPSTSFHFFFSFDKYIQNTLFNQKPDERTSIAARPLISSRKKANLFYFLLRLCVLVAFTGVVYLKWVTFTYICILFIIIVC